MEKISKEDVVQALGNLSVIQLIALTKELEAQWGVKAEPQFQQVIGLPTEVNNVEQTEFNVILNGCPAEKKIPVLKIVREIIGLGLKEAKEFVEAAPKIIKEGVSAMDAEMYRVKLEEAGASVEIK